MEQRGFIVQWHITDRCNLQCIHCYRNEKVEDLPLSRLKLIADTVVEGLKTMHMSPFFALSGGEPFLRDDVFDLVEYLAEKGVENIMFETNGTLLTPEIIQKVIQHSPPIGAIQVSLDGGPVVNDSIRGEGVFEKVVEGLKRVISDTHLVSAVSYTFHSQNYMDIPRVIELGEKIGVNIFHFTRLVPLGRGKEMDVLTPEQTREVLMYLYEKNKEFKKSIKDGTQKPLIVERRSLFHLVDEDEAIKGFTTGGERLGNACAIGMSTFTILADGTGVLCRRLPLPVGNLLEERFLDIWFKNDLLWEFRKRDKLLKGKCRNCKFLKYQGLCDGGAACVTYGYCGDYNNPDPQCWYEPEVP